MAETKTIDARGLACPQPVILTEKIIKGQAGGMVVVLVDSPSAKENVTRLGEKNGWKVNTEAQTDGSYRIVLSK